MQGFQMELTLDQWEYIEQGLQLFAKHQASESRFQKSYDAQADRLMCASQCIALAKDIRGLIENKLNNSAF